MTYLEKIEKIDKQIEENMPMVGSRNIEYIDMLFHVRNHIEEVYGDKIEKIVSSEQGVSNDVSIMIKSLNSYKTTHDKTVAKKELENFMSCLCQEFTVLAEMTDDCIEHKAIIKNKIKEIFHMFN